MDFLSTLVKYIEFEIERSQTAVVELTKENRLTPGGVVLTKIDDQSGEVLQGAVFELQDANGTVLQSGLTTGADGKLAIDGLAPGAYQLVETQAPTGYELDATPVTFKIEKEQEAAIFLTKENRKYTIEYLEQYKTFEEARKEAERLNNLPKNKKRAKEWNSPESIFKRKVIEESLRKTRWLDE